MLNRPLPHVTFRTRVRDESIGADNPYRWKDMTTADYFADKRAVLFSLPGAFTPTCSTFQLPDFETLFPDFRGRGFDAIYCISVNDAQVLAHWAESTGARAVGIEVLSDWQSEWTKAAGLEFSAPPVGFIDRCQRCAMIVNDGVVEVMQMEEERGVCNMTAGETLLELV